MADYPRRAIVRKAVASSYVVLPAGSLRERVSACATGHKPRVTAPQVLTSNGSADFKTCRIAFHY